MTALAGLEPFAVANLEAGRRARSAAGLRPGSPEAALRRSRVDLIRLIEQGIPEREYVPGAAGLIPKAKRLHVAAPAKAGKSIAFGVVTALDIIAAGGSVVVLDRENGRDEYARRLDDVLNARGADEKFCREVRQRLRYHDWPALSLDWRDDPAYPAEFAGADVVVFDGTRSHTAPLKLAEDSSDDWALFTASLIDPLMQTGIATIALDNSGHDSRRPRGTSSKEDLSDMVLVLTGKPFSKSHTGLLTLECSHSRIGEITPGDTWQMTIGSGTYSSWRRCNTRNADASSKPRPEAMMQAISEAVEQTPGIGTKGIRDAVKGSSHEKDYALNLLVEEGYVKCGTKGQRAHKHQHIRPYRADRAKPCQTTPPARFESTVPTVPLPVGGGTEAGTERGHDENGDRAKAVPDRSDLEAQALIDPDPLSADQQGAQQ
jgi:AAA domain